MSEIKEQESKVGVKDPEGQEPSSKDALQKEIEEKNIQDKARGEHSSTLPEASPETSSHDANAGEQNALDDEEGESQKQEKEVKPPPTTFKEKLIAWWNEEYKFGVPEVIRQRANKTEDVQEVKKLKRPPRLEPLADPTKWSKERIDLCRDIWESDYSDEIVSPESPSFSMELAVYLNLMPGTTVIDMFAGIGGFARVLSKRLDVWVVCMETEATLAIECNTLSHSHGVEKKVTSAHYNPQEVELATNRYTAAFVRERFHSVEDKKSIILKIKESLQERGHVVITDLMLPSPDMAEHPDVVAWKEACPYPVYLWTVAEYQKAIKECKLFFHVKQDKTEEMLQIFKRQLAKFLKDFSLDEQTANSLRYVESELKHWTALEKALQSGALTYTRIHASKG